MRVLATALLLTTPLVAVVAGPASTSSASPSVAAHVTQDAVAPGVTSRQVDPMGGRPTAVSCPSTSFCVAADSFGRVVYDRNGVWSAPTPIEPTPTTFTGGASISTVSCASATFCAAFDSSGDAYVYDGTTWSRTPHAGILSGDNEMGSLSCLPNFCLGMVGDESTIYDGHSWSTPTDVGMTGAGELTSVSCVTSTFCVAVDTVGSAAVYNGTSWSVTQNVVPGTYSTASVSCSSATFCATVQGADAATFDGTQWSPAAEVGSAGAYLQAVSCPADGTCTAVDSSGAALDLAAGSWTRAAGISANQNLVALDCAAVGECVAVDRFGGATTRSATTWGATTNVDQNTGGLNAISCTGSSFCAATDLSGNALVYRGATWSAPAPVDLHAYFSSLSCASSTLCVAAGSKPSADGRSYLGAVAMFDGHSWKETQNAPVLADVSCVSSGFCLGIGYDGTSVTYRNGVWSQPTPSGVQDLGQTAACASATFCATGSETFDGTSWHVTSGQTSYVRSISCVSSTYCAAPNGMFMSVYNGTSWKITRQAASWSSGDAIDCVTTSFCMTVAKLGDSAVAFERGRPQQPTEIDSDLNSSGGLAGVSCQSTERCMAVDSTRVISWRTHVVPTVTTQPHGGTAPLHGTFTLTASGTGNPAPQAAWQRRQPPSTAWTNYGQGPTLTTNQSGDYRAAFTNSAGTTYSAVAHVTIGVAPHVTKQPTSKPAVKGHAVTFISSAQGTPKPTVRWQRSLDGGTTWVAVRGGVHPTLHITATVSARYRAAFISSAGYVISHTATLTVVTRHR